MGTSFEHSKSNEYVGTQERLLLERIQNGDKKAFAELVSDYEKPIYRICYRFFGNEEDSLDAVQEVFIKVYRYIGKFEGKSSLKTWIYRIAANTCITAFEKKKKEKEGFFKVFSNWFNSFYQASPEDQVIEQETSLLNVKTVTEKLSDLPEIYRMPVILKDIEGFSMDKIGEVLEIPLGTVKSRINRGRAILHDLLRPYYKGESYE
ncbi:MAG: sigma-70 family RNA polymerase sigma factor [Candidatus Riflebacteria bacterium]|nr:sigma-70 family RNA polymerase sigma factor [Candidatus Riflebacteria bacterium]